MIGRPSSPNGGTAIESGGRSADEVAVLTLAEAEYSGVERVMAN